MNPRRLSRLLSYVLRHGPGDFDLELERGGWVPIHALIAALARRDLLITAEQLETIVRTNDKQRFAISPDGSRIRANQGHSIEVDLQLTALPPPAVLFHGTVAKALPGISRSGLIAGERHHVHLSPDEATAAKVGARRGRPVVLQVASGEMSAGGHAFFRSDNGVWLTAHVPARFITFPKPWQQ